MGASCTKNTGVVNDVGTPKRSADPLLLELTDEDVLVCILSFVSYAPFELDNENDEAERLVKDYNKGITKLNNILGKQRSVSPFRPSQEYIRDMFHRTTQSDTLARVTCLQRFGTLTHVLPLVNKRLYELCNESSILWKEALERLMGVKNPLRSVTSSDSLWEQGLESYIESCKQEETIETSSNVSNKDYQDDPERLGALISRACVVTKQNQEAGPSPPSSECAARVVLQQVHLHHKPFRLPVFVMTYPVRLKQAVSFHLFEPRYRDMMAELMEGRSAREQSGFPISTPRPQFLFGCTSPPLRKIVACLVEVVKCKIHSDGTADVMVMPVKWVLTKHRITRQTRPETRGLWEATVVRCPKRATFPVFFLQSDLTLLGQPKRLRLFEERYKLLISEVMNGRNEDDLSSGPPPQFLFANQAHMKEGNVACVVDVQEFSRENSASDSAVLVTVIPRRLVLIERLEKRPRSGGLHDATVLFPTIG